MYISFFSIIIKKMTFLKKMNENDFGTMNAVYVSIGRM